MRRPYRIGLPVLRPENNPTPCAKCPKVPDDAPERTSRHAVEPSERSLRAWQHYLECRAVGQFPDDPIVRRNAALFRRVEAAWERQPMQQLLSLICQAPRDRR